jgi:prepilin-type N-terminal cleavage/methylation domain-containing protein
MLFLMVAGFLKLADLPDFMASLRTWRSLSPTGIAVASVLVPPTEVVVAGLWVMGLARRRCEVAAALLLIFFTGAYLWEWGRHGVPHCGCLGLIAGRLEFLEEAPHVVARNALLLLLLVAGVTVARAVQGDSPDAVASQPQSNARGFTLLELILTVAIFGLLAALIAPSLGATRHSARVVKSLSNLRQHAASVHSYAGEHRDLFPYLADPQSTFSIIRCRSADIAVPVRYFTSVEYWWLGLADGYYNGQWNSPAFLSPFDRWYRSPGRYSSYVMACSTIARPEFYSLEERREPPLQFKPVKMSEVLYPSHKGILTDSTVYQDIAPHIARERGYDARFRFRFLAALADGHAAQFDPRSQLGPQLNIGDGWGTMRYGSHYPWMIPMTHTLHGVRGRDVR